MAKIIDIQISESELKLKQLYNKETSILKRSRLKALLLIKQGKCKYTKEVAKKVKYDRRSVYNWLKMYEEGGLDNLCTVSSGGNNTKLLKESTIKEIDKLLNNPNSTITSYVELLSILSETTQKDITYSALYQHCKSKHYSKLKVARKSHHKKDEQAVEAFKKTPQCID